MKLIAFEAATRRLSVALWCDGTVSEKCADFANGGSEVLLPWALELLAESGLTLKQLDGIAFGAGPGGFTGLRLACGVTQGLACGLDLPLVPVSTLAALALAAGDGLVLTCLDARMNEVYLGAYRVAGGEVTALMAPKVGAGGTAPLPEGDGFRGVGDGFATPHGEAIRARMGGRLEAVDAALFPSAAACARLAAPLLARGEGVSAREAQPVYLRDKVALTVAERRARGGEK
ncbi:tRNA (adenosine(37)-N6)-threonylcarbamoyltransferase complex dimerization subunit type 1 TsaB [Sulfuricystis thermophila]|uniref:tRNA (adenosine(37)-N6)-threonylcarbamoyltransferase complex dimerization subunit type 1 TsaB n=1 Tax=Sulfuricystis thermophila TaxID=2496847 RepID=UPI001035889A|nr:tRNA (adenosine(37)-N6)-threonylcarbamoyltransferase complex dimerization subunit type 1 TsaB [Sulfuricystis thermophila]